MIDKNSPIPAYYQLKEKIKEKILNKTYIVGQCIESERELSEKYSVSRMTVRQALGELVQDGLLIREKGKGTFVSEPKVKQKDMMSFSEIINKMGKNLKTVVRSFTQIDMPEEFEGIFPFKMIYAIDRLRYVDGVCIAIEKVYIPKEYIGHLEKDMLEGSLFKLIEAKGYSIDYAEASIKAVIMDAELKEIFESDSNLPLIQTISKTITSDGKVLYIEESTYRSDKYILEVNILRREGKIK